MVVDDLNFGSPTVGGVQVLQSSLSDAAQIAGKVPCCSCEAIQEKVKSQ